MKANPWVASQEATSSGERSTRIPKASKTSAAPDLDVIARLPCFATHAPAAAATKATVVEMLKVFSWSPPVPQTSSTPFVLSESGTGTVTDNRLSAPAKPAISSGVSPLCARAVRKSAFSITAIAGSASAVTACEI